MKIDTDMEKTQVSTRTRQIIEAYAICYAVSSNDEEREPYQARLNQAYGEKVSVTNENGELYANLESGKKYHICKMPNIQEILGQK